uniref:Uncharacterized protein n=1 Tax=Romanomermis culicivorax TaxID=13658 RepID=A0A915L9N0_ROMCU
MAKEKERYIALSTTDKPAKEERYLKFTAATRLKKPQSEFSRAKCSPSTLSIPSDDKSDCILIILRCILKLYEVSWVVKISLTSPIAGTNTTSQKVVVIREKRPQILAPKKRRSNMPAPNTGTDVPTYLWKGQDQCEISRQISGHQSGHKHIAYKTKSPTATARPAYYGYQGALGSNLLTKQIDRVRLEHERVMKEERGQNCCLCGLLALSIFVAAALLAVGFYDRTMPRGSTNLTKSEEIDSPIYFAEVEINQD